MSISLEMQSRFVDLVDNLECKKSEIPKLIGINYTSYISMINYGAIPMMSTLIKIADFFDISIEYLFGRSNEEYFDKAKKPATFHERLDELREAEKITYYELGKRLHLAPNFFTEWKKNNHIPNLDNLMLIADYFKVSVDYLLGRTDDRNILL